MRVHNPPHSGLAIREDLGEPSVLAVAQHLGAGQVTL